MPQSQKSQNPLLLLTGVYWVSKPLIPMEIKGKETRSHLWIEGAACRMRGLMEDFLSSTTRKARSKGYRIGRDYKAESFLSLALQLLFKWLVTILLLIWETFIHNVDVYSTSYGLEVYYQVTVTVWKYSRNQQVELNTLCSLNYPPSQMNKRWCFLLVTLSCWTHALRFLCLTV